MHNYLIDNTLEQIDYILQYVSDHDERKIYLSLKISLHQIQSILQSSIDESVIKLALVRLFAIITVAASKAKYYSRLVCF